MKASDYKAHADLIECVIVRHTQTADPNPLVLLVLSMLEHEYRHAHEIMPVDPE